jgi:UDP-N-acetylmuramoyl-tripeptide--D-alanyl-D-alanine ligase
VELPMMGQHQIYNALQAAAVGREFGLELEEIVEGLKSVALPEMRMQLESIGDVRVFNDAYNANPDSMRAALETFRHLQATGRKIAVLGDMLELGNCAGIAHASVGEQVAKLKQVKLLITVGSLARLIGESAKRHGMDARQVMELETADEAAMFLKMCVHGGDCVLLKGSRRVGLERVVEVLREHNKEEEDSALGKRARANRTGLVSVCD